MSPEVKKEYTHSHVVLSDQKSKKICTICIVLPVIFSKTFFIRSFFVDFQNSLEQI